MNMIENFINSNQLVKHKKYSELFLIFNLSEKAYAVSAEKIVEILQLPALTVVEKFPDHVAGLLNLRGQVILVIDPGKLLGFEQRKYTTDHQVLIIQCNDRKIGIIVDSVSNVIQLDRDNLEPLPYKPKEKIISGIYKYENNLIAFLNTDSILENIENISPEGTETQNNTSIINNHFATDEISKTKFLKRAEKLQKEIRGTQDSLNYQENYFISFCLNKEIYCINLKHVREITKLKLVNLVPIPCVPGFIMGIINLRGEFITLVDIKYFLNIPETPLSDKTKIIVVKISDIQIGILVDEVFNIENISSEKMNLNSQTKYEKSKYTSAEVMLSNNKIMSILDLKKFIDDERLFIEDSI